jgi:hypothetical protein
MEVVENKITSSLVNKTEDYQPRKLSFNQENDLTYSKFDQFDPLFRDARLTNIIQNMGRDYKSFQKNKFDEAMTSNVKRDKSYSFGNFKDYRFQKNKLVDYPVNKDYSLNLTEKVEDKMKLRYDNKQMSSVYFHMILMKKMDLPDEFKDEKFVEDIMLNQPKQSLEIFKKKQVNRPRAFTNFDGPFYKRFSEFY